METRGIEPVPGHERRGGVRELFPTWVAADISVLLLTMGAGLVVFNGLNFWQVLLAAAVAGTVSFGLVGLLAVSGKWGGAPGAMLSRATFGVRGNYFPGMVLFAVLPAPRENAPRENASAGSGVGDRPARDRPGRGQRGRRRCRPRERTGSVGRRARPAAGGGLARVWPGVPYE
ncbi:hypothetical protein GCM10009863_58500 [Streptomyces axinellae]|uniref:Uncharacterized protein n=1 Tax=Streptomyces axinellae TaxID=552788 RepID=A0ABN3QT04_9ACTN